MRLLETTAILNDSVATSYGWNVSDYEHNGL